MSEMLSEMYIGLHVKRRLILSDSNETGIFWTEISKNPQNIKVHENPSTGNQDVACERTDMTKLTGAFRNFAKSAQNFLITSLQ